MSRSRLSILSNASKVDVQLEPYPHIGIKNALDKEIFEQLSEEYPVPETVLNGRDKKDTWFDYPACLALDNPSVSPLWKEFMRYHVSKDFYLDVLDLFGDVIGGLHPQLELAMGKSLEEFESAMRLPEKGDNALNHASDVSLECQFYVNYTENPRAVRGPHVDRPSELYAALLYFRHPDDCSSGSDLQVCAAREPNIIYPTPRSIKVDKAPMEVEDDRIDVVSTIDYDPNTLVFFLNSARSLHAVSPRSATPIPRRHVNFTADVFNAPELFEVRYGLRSALKQWMKDKPMLWRLSNRITE